MATPQGTAHYFSRHSLSTPPIELGRTGWKTAPVGFGSYRIHTQSWVHQQALRLALLNGCNLVDTSTNYGNGSSELLIGQTLAELIRESKIKRDEIVLVSKIGYVQGDNLALVHHKIAEKTPFTEMVEYSPDCWHCISPDFLEDQLTRSLERLRVERLDVLLLHNPEYFLKAGGDHETYYARIRRAFDYLETEAARGRIQYYGVSSNSLPEPREADDYTSLEVLLSIAQEIGPHHHFAVIQFPLNLGEPGAAFECSNSGKSVIELAHARRIATLINRPFNSFRWTRQGHEMLRLTDAGANGTESALTKALDQACPDLLETPELSRKSVRIYRSVPGVDCVLVGMRRPEYVREILRLDLPLTPEQAFDCLDAAQGIISAL